MLKKLYRLQETFGQRGIYAAFVAAIRFFYQRQRVNLSARPIDPGFFPEINEGCPPDVQCIVLETPEALDPVCARIPPSFRDSAQRLGERLAEGCILFLAQRTGTAGLNDPFIGYSLAQRGVFSALGWTARISPDTLFIHYIEVLPEYRRSGVAKVIVRRRYEYCKANHIGQTVTVGSSRNKLSQLAFRKQRQSHRLGTMQKISLLGGLWVWETPWQKIHRALDSFAGEVDSNIGAKVTIDLSRRDCRGVVGKKVSPTARMP